MYDLHLGLLYMVLGPAGNRQWFGSGRPKRPLKPLQKVGGEAPHLLEWFLGPLGPPRPEKSAISDRPKIHVLKTKCNLSILPNSTPIYAHRPRTLDELQSLDTSYEGDSRRLPPTGIQAFPGSGGPEIATLHSGF